MLNAKKKGMRILFAADRHVPSNRSQLGPWYKAHDEIVRIAKAMEVDCVFDAGDSRVDCNSSRHADACERQHLILPLAKLGIGYRTLDGNHDRPGAAHGEITANSWLQDLRDRDLWQGVEYYNDYKLRIYDFNGQKLQVLPLPYPPRHVFALGKELKTKQELDRAASEYIQGQLSVAAKLIDPDMPLIVLFHGTVDSPRLQTAGESRMPAGHDVNVPINVFPRVGDRDPLVFYTGPLVPQEFDHEGMDTGVVCVEIPSYPVCVVACGHIHKYQELSGENNPVDREFVPIVTRQYKTAEVDLRKDLPLEVNTEDYICDEVARQIGSDHISFDYENLVVKVVIKANSDTVDKAAVVACLEASGIIDPRVHVELPESPGMKQLEQTIHEEIGSNVTANLQAFLKERTEFAAGLATAGAGEQDVMDAAEGIEREAFNAI